MPRTAEGINKRAENRVKNPGSGCCQGEGNCHRAFLSCPDSCAPQ